MALTPQDNESFYREVDDQVRQERFAEWWRRYGRLALVAAVVALLAIAALLIWRSHRESVAGQEGVALSSVLDDVAAGKTDVAARLKPLADTGDPAYRAAARLLQADLSLQGGDLKAAVAGYAAVAGDGALAQPYRDLATIRGTAAAFDTLPPASVIDRLRPLAVAGSPWFGSAAEMTAIAYLKMGKPALAGPLFAAIAKDDKAASSIRSRAAQVAGVLGVDAAPVATARKD